MALPSPDPPPLARLDALVMTWASISADLRRVCQKRHDGPAVQPFEPLVTRPAFRLGLSLPSGITRARLPLHVSRSTFLFYGRASSWMNWPLSWPYQEYPAITAVICNPVGPHQGCHRFSPDGPERKPWLARVRRWSGLWQVLEVGVRFRELSRPAPHQPSSPPNRVPDPAALPGWTGYALRCWSERFCVRMGHVENLKRPAQGYAPWAVWDGFG